jgi:hypothetical protein
MLRRAYAWLHRLAATRYALAALALISFGNARSFVPSKASRGAIGAAVASHNPPRVRNPQPEPL